MYGPVVRDGHSGIMAEGGGGRGKGKNDFRANFFVGHASAAVLFHFSQTFPQEAPTTCMCPTNKLIKP